MAAVGRADRVGALGVDVERAESLSAHEAALILDDDERAAAARGVDPTVIWTAKEAAFKAWAGWACGLGGVDPADVHVCPDDGTTFQVWGSGEVLATMPPLFGATATVDGVILTVVSIAERM